MKNISRASKKRTAVLQKEPAFSMAIVSSRGQVTIPQQVRSLLHVRTGSVIGFEATQRGILIRPMKVEPQEVFTEAEWRKLEKLSKGKGTVYNTPDEAKRHLDSI